MRSVPHILVVTSLISPPPPPPVSSVLSHGAGRGLRSRHDGDLRWSSRRELSPRILASSRSILATRRSSCLVAIASRECSLINSEKRLERRTMPRLSSSRPRVHSGRPVMDDIAHGADIAVVSGDKRIFAARNAAASTVRATTGRLSSGCRSVVEGVSGCERKE